MPESEIAVKTTREPSGENAPLYSGVLRSVSRYTFAFADVESPRTSSTYSQICEPPDS